MVVRRLASHRERQEVERDVVFAARARQKRRLPDLDRNEQDLRWVFVYGFAKNEHSNVAKDKTEALKTLAAYLMNVSNAALEKPCNSGELTEVNCNA